MKRLFLLFLTFISLGFLNFSYSQSYQLKKIVLDAGHGGKDPGNLGTGRYKETEKEITLAVTLKLGEYIRNNLPHIEVIYTRDADVYPTLLDRANLANSVSADLFLSIHCDAFTSKSAHGSGSYVMGLDYTDENLRMAQKENSSIYLEDNYKERYQGFDPNSIESVIALTLNQSVYMEQSIIVAQKIQEEFKKRVKRKDRGVRQAPYFVTSRTLMPSVLVELGFLTNPEEEDFLRSEKGQSYMASALYRAIKNYSLSLDEISAYNSSDSDDKIEEIQQETPAEKPIFKVQIKTSLELENINNVDGNKVSYYIEGKLYKFTIGNEGHFEDVIKLKDLAKKNGYPDAFIISFLDNKKISIQEAKNKINE